MSTGLDLQLLCYRAHTVGRRYLGVYKYNSWMCGWILHTKFGFYQHSVFKYQFTHKVWHDISLPDKLWFLNQSSDNVDQTNRGGELCIYVDFNLYIYILIVIIKLTSASLWEISISRKECLKKKYCVANYGNILRMVTNNVVLF